MASTTGRRVVVPLTNKSGGSVAAGDVVVIDTANDDAFTTTTTAGFTGTVGIAQETIANNATGLVLLAGEAALINVSASVTRGNYGATHTVAKQAASAGASRVAGTFVQFKTGGTTPKGIVYPVDLQGAAGNVATDAIWDAAGDLAVGTGANTAAKLTVGASGKAPISNGTTLAYAYPPGYEFDYVEITSSASVTSTTEATPDTVITANAVTYDGSTSILIEFFSPGVYSAATANIDLTLQLYDGSTRLGIIGVIRSETTNRGNVSLKCERRLTPSNAAHTYSIRAFMGSGSGAVQAGAGGPGSSVNLPAFLRQTKV